MAKAAPGKILKKKAGYKVEGKLWIEYEGEKYFGPGPVELLEKIEATGSLNKAAKEMNMSYKKALKIVTSLNTRSAAPFVLLHAGGTDGGGSEITAEAKQMISYYRNLRKRFSDFLKTETDQFRKF